MAQFNPQAAKPGNEVWDRTLTWNPPVVVGEFTAEDSQITALAAYPGGGVYAVGDTKNTEGGGQFPLQQGMSITWITQQGGLKLSEVIGSNAGFSIYANAVQVGSTGAVYVGGSETGSTDEQDFRAVSVGNFGAASAPALCIKCAPSVEPPAGYVQTFVTIASASTVAPVPLTFLQVFSPPVAVTLTPKLAAWGSVTPSGQLMVFVGTDIALSANPSGLTCGLRIANYCFLDWTSSSPLVTLGDPSNPQTTAFVSASATSGASFTITGNFGTFVLFTTSGLPAGTQWSFTFDGVAYSTSSVYYVIPNVASGAHKFQLSPVYQCNPGGSGCSYQPEISGLVTTSLQTLQVTATTTESITYAEFAGVTFQLTLQSSVPPSLQPQFAISGCNSSPAAISGNDQAVTVDAAENCPLIVSYSNSNLPSNERYAFFGGSSQTQTFTCNAGPSNSPPNPPTVLCNPVTIVYYFQVSNTLSVFSSPGNFANGIKITVTGTQYAGAGKALCSFAPLNTGTQSCSAWSDYDTAIVFPVASSNNPVSTRWLGTGQTSFLPLSGGNPYSVIYDEQFQITFNVSPVGSGATTPAGSNVWENDGSLNVKATPKVGYSFSQWSSNTASITFLSASSATTVASLMGPGTITADIPTNTGLTLAASTGQIVVGNSVTFTAILKSQLGGAISGASITFYDKTDSNIIGTGITSSTGAATLTYFPPHGGSFTYNAQYAGTGVISPAASNAVTVGIFDFAISVGPNSGTVNPGGQPSPSPTVTVSSLGGTFQDVQFTIAVSPTGPTATLSQNNCNSACALPLSLTTADSTPVGEYVVTVTGTVTAAVSLVHSVTYMLFVTNPTTLTLSVAPNNVQTGSPVTFTATLDFGANLPVSGESVAFYPLGSTTSIGSANTNAAGIATLNYFEYFSGSIDYDAVFAGDNAYGPSTSGVVLVTITTPPPFEFSFTVGPLSVTTGQGGSGYVALSVNLVQGGANAVTFTSSGTPADSTVASGICTPAPTCSLTLPISVPNDVPPGSYSVTITGKGGGATETQTFTLNVVSTSSLLVQSCTNSSTTPVISLSCQLPMGVNPNDMIIVEVFDPSGAAGLAYDSQGGTFNLLSDLSVPGGSGASLSLSYGFDPRGGFDTFTAETTQGSSPITIVVHELSTVGNVISSSTGSGASTTPSVTSYTPTAASLVYSFLVASPSAGLAADSGPGYAMMSQFPGFLGEELQASAPGSPTTSPFQLSSSENWAEFSVSLLYGPPFAILQPISLLAGQSGVSPQTFTLTGCGATPSTILGDGQLHDIAATASCTMTITGPSTTYTRYMPVSTQVTTCIGRFSGQPSTPLWTCGAFAGDAYYYQLLNWYQFVPSSPSTWDARYVPEVTGTSLGASGSGICGVATVSGGGAVSCAGWSDSATAVSFPNAVSSWIGQAPLAFTSTTGDNTYSVNYKLATGTAVVQTCDAYAPSGVQEPTLTCTLSKTVTKGDLIVLEIVDVGPYVSDSMGDSYSFLATQTLSTTTYDVFFYAATAQSSGTDTVTLHGQGNYPSIIVNELSGGATPGSFEEAYGTSASPSVPSYTPSPGSVVLAAVFVSGGGTASAGSGYTLVTQTTSLSDEYAPSPGATTSPFQLGTSASWGEISFSFSQAATSSGSVTQTCFEQPTSGTSSSCTFTSQVTAGQLLVVEVETNQAVTVSDTLGDSFTFVTSTCACDNGVAIAALSAYYGTAKATGAVTITVSGGSIAYGMVAHVLSGVSTLDSFSTGGYVWGSVPPSFGSTVASFSPPSGSFVLAATEQYGSTLALGAGPGFTLEGNYALTYSLGDEYGSMTGSTVCPTYFPTTLNNGYATTYIWSEIAMAFS
ncbi:MAG: Ig-like domain-containing protein [Thaumarchaeota archaeon]|nr:Ig-like domain-containing protein [Nitrososphaerota archaeon]